MQDIYKVQEVKGEWVIKVLVYNPKVWHAWSYSYVTSDYPNSDIKYATKFKSQESAVEFINQIFKD